MRWMLAWSLVFGFIIAGQTADARVIGKHSDFVASVPDGFSCADSVTVNIRAASRNAFVEKAPDLAKVVGLVRVVIGFECPQVKEITFDGYHGNRKVTTAKVSAASNWKLAGFTNVPGSGQVSKRPTAPAGSMRGSPRGVSPSRPNTVVQGKKAATAAEFTAQAQHGAAKKRQSTWQPATLGKYDSKTCAPSYLKQHPLTKFPQFFGPKYSVPTGLLASNSYEKLYAYFKHLGATAKSLRKQNDTLERFFYHLNRYEQYVATKSRYINYRFRNKKAAEAIKNEINQSRPQLIKHMKSVVSIIHDRNIYKNKVILELSRKINNLGPDEMSVQNLIYFFTVGVQIQKCVGEELTYSYGRYGASGFPKYTPGLSVQLNRARELEKAVRISESLSAILTEKALSIPKSQATRFVDQDLKRISDIRELTAISSYLANIFRDRAEKPAHVAAMISRVNEIQKAQAVKASAYEKWARPYYWIIKQDTPSSDRGLSKREREIKNAFRTEHHRMLELVRNASPVKCVRETRNYISTTICSQGTAGTEKAINQIMAANRKVAINRKKIENACARDLKPSVCKCFLQTMDGHLTKTEYGLFLKSPKAFAAHKAEVFFDGQGYVERGRRYVKRLARKKFGAVDAAKAYLIRTGSDQMVSECRSK